MSTLIETFEAPNGSTIEIHYDTDPESPREWDNLGTFWTFHPRYSSPDRNPNQTETPPEGTIWLPVYLYDHGGVCYRTTPFSCPWDSGLVGFIWTSNETARAYFGRELPRSEIERYLKAEVETYSQWANGQIYGFVIPETGDSCWGFYSIDHAKEEALACI